MTFFSKKKLFFIVKLMHGHSRKLKSTEKHRAKCRPTRPRSAHPGERKAVIRDLTAAPDHRSSLVIREPGFRLVPSPDLAALAVQPRAGCLTSQSWSPPLCDGNNDGPCLMGLL